MATLAPACVLLAYGYGHLLPLQIAGISCCSLAMWFLAAQSRNLYRPLQGTEAFRLGPFAASALMWLAGLYMLLLALRSDIAIGTTLAWLVAGLVLSLTMRLGARIRLQSRLRDGQCIDRALVMAKDRPAARAAAAELEASSGGSIRAAACIPIPGTAGAPCLAWVEDAICSAMIDRVYIVGYDNLDVAFNEILPQLAGLDIDVTLLSERPGGALAPVCCARVGRLYAIPLSSRAMGAVRTCAKRVMDLVLAWLIIAAFSPVLLAIALAIKLNSPGPVLFAQRREGFRGEVFRVFKFRTMFTHLGDEAAVSQTCRADRRVTGVGRILRRFSLDELPQLINVIRGEMSIVGPRPHALGMTVDGRRMDDLLAEYRVRHRVKPGITGWAQINGCRGEVNTAGRLRRRVALDCEYIERSSVALDIWIVLRTAGTLLFNDQAY